ncbi:MAG: BF3164 family lipoprotein [Candidatus Palauibacterales bacterium]|nr:BF3164 family lipoprotein [Candidatus Palauibacterales bacterium]
MSTVLKVPLGAAGFLLWMGVAFGSHSPAIPAEELGPLPIAPVSLSGELLYDGEMLAMPTRIAITNDRIALVDGFAERPVHLLDASGRYLAGFGRQGEGPGEFEGPRAIEPTADGSGFWVFDMSLSRLTLVEPDGWDSTPASERLILPIHGPAPVTSLVRRVDDTFLAAGFFGEGRLGHFTRGGDYEGATGSIPAPEVDAPPEVRQHAYRGTLKAAPSLDRLVLANRHAGYLEVFDAEGESLRRIEGPYPFEPGIDVVIGERGPAFAPGDDLRFGYVDVAVTDDRIYALFSGRTRAGHPGEAIYGREVHVFDWNGGLVSVLLLDADAMAIAVDVARDRLLVVRHLPTPALLSYDLAPAGLAGGAIRQAD